MADRLHQSLAALIVMIALGTVVGWRVLGSGQTKPGLALATTPSPQLNQLIPYSSPLPDTLTMAPVVPRSNDTIMVARDPFAAPLEPQTLPAARPMAVSSRASKPTGPRWDVTATLIAGERRAAVINDVLIYVGDDVPGGSGIKLTAVERDHVVVTDSKGTAHTLAVKQRDG